MAIKSFKRYEKKFLLSKEQYDRLIPILSEYMNPDKFCKDGKNYSIYNIYYDTSDNSVIRHSIDKPYYKEKLRLRSYKVPRSMNDIVFLELKKKINGIVNKRRVTLTLGDAYCFLEKGIKPETKDYINNKIIKERDYYLGNNKIEPTVYIGYSRKAYFAKDNPDFRITFDSHITTRRQDLALELGCYGKELMEPNHYLMEVKILGAIPVWLTKILSEFKIYNTHFSKYGNEYMRYSQNINQHNLRRKDVC